MQREEGDWNRTSKWEGNWKAGQPNHLANAGSLLSTRLGMMDVCGRVASYVVGSDVLFFASHENVFTSLESSLGPLCHITLSGDLAASAHLQNATRVERATPIDQREGAKGEHVVSVRTN